MGLREGEVGQTQLGRVTSQRSGEGRMFEEGCSGRRKLLQCKCLGLVPQVQMVGGTSGRRCSSQKGHSWDLDMGKNLLFLLSMHGGNSI